MRTVAQLARQYHRSDEWVRTKLAQYQLPTLAHQPRQVVVIMDVTYFGPWGVLVVIDPNAQTAKGQNLVLYHCFLEGSERTLHYEVALDTLEAMGYRVVGATIDGRRGVRELLEARHIPVQHCQFHQLQTVTKYLTRRPYLTQNQQLRSIALTSPRAPKMSSHGASMPGTSSTAPGSNKKTQLRVVSCILGLARPTLVYGATCPISSRTAMQQQSPSPTPPML